MGEKPCETVLILASRQSLARHWAAMLQGADLHICFDRNELPPRAPTLVVTDLALADDGERAAWQVGTIYIGDGYIGDAEAITAGPAEVRLPADLTGRELRLACQLLIQIVRLRRQHPDAAELRRLAQEALTDPLTGLPNRRAWDRALAQRLAALPPSQRLCLAILDLDHFKRINDTYGHIVGDTVLQACARAVSSGLRQDDLVARLGGDEFGLLLWVRDEAAASSVVERVRTRVPQAACRPTQATPRQPTADAEPPAPPMGCMVTASAGYCLTPDLCSAAPLPCPAELLAAADRALVTAKRQGRDRTVREG